MVAIMLSEEGREGRSGQCSGAEGEGPLDSQMPGMCQGHKISSLVSPPWSELAEDLGVQPPFLGS